MKMKKLLLTMLISFTVSQLFAQLTDTRKAEIKKNHSEAPIVVKARLLEQAYEPGFKSDSNDVKKMTINGVEMEITESYDDHIPAEKSNEINTGYIVEVIEIYKGQPLIDLGKILIRYSPQSHKSTLRYGDNILFLYPEKSGKTYKSTVTKGQLPSSINSQFVLTGAINKRTYSNNEEWFSREGQLFESSNALYEYLNNLDGVSTKTRTLRTTTIPKISEEEQKTNYEKAIQLNRKIYEQGQERLKIKEAQKKSANQRTLQTTGSVDLTITFDNPKNIALNGNAQDRWMQFDVMIKASASGTYLDNIAFSLEYQTTRFSSNAVSNSNIVAIKDGIFNTNSYTSPAMQDVQNDIIRFQMGLNGFPSDGLSVVEVPTTFTKLMEVRMKINGSQNTFDLDFNNTGFFEVNFYYTNPISSNSDFNSYTTTTYQAATNLPFQPDPIITSVTTSPIAAGTGQIIVITGDHFGEPNFPTAPNVSSVHQVQFVEADEQSGTSYMDNLDNSDYILWTDTRIEISLPFSAYQNNRNPSTDRMNPTPGSGRFFVVNDWNGTTLSSASQIVTITHAQRHTRVQPPNKRPVFLSKSKCYDGLVFRLGSNIANNSQAVNAIEQALSEWSNATGLVMELEKDVTGLIRTESNPSSITDGKNLIFFNTNVSYMATATRSARCSGDISEALTDTDILINPNPAIQWDYSLAGTVNGAAFYEAFLHELGHAIGLGHSTNSGDLMNPTIRANISSGQRINLVTGSNEVVGGNNMVNRSSSANYSCGSFVALNSTQACYTTWNGSTWDNGYPHSSSNAIVNGNYNSATQESFEAASLTINSGNTLEIATDDFIDIKGNVNNNGSLIGRSGSSLLIDGVASGTNYSFTRRTSYPGTNGSYSMIGSPVQNASFGVLGSAAQNHTYVYVEPNPALTAPGKFIRPSNAGISTMQVGAGYFSAFSGDANGDVTFSGRPSSGNLSVSVTRTNNANTNPSEAPHDGYNILSNPYTCAINASDFLNQNLGTIENFISIWDDAGSNNGSNRGGAYIVVTNTNSVSGGSGRASDWDGNIHCMQGFSVRAISSGNVTFSPSMYERSPNDDQGFFRTANENQSEIRITLSNESFYDETLVLINDGASNGHDSNFDVMKDFILPNGFEPSVSVYSKLDDLRYCIQGISNNTDFKVIPVGIKVDKSGSYSLDLTLTGEGINGFYPYLLDKTTSEIFEMNASYSFNATSDEPDDRFVLVLSPESFNSSNISESLVYVSNNQLRVNIKGLERESMGTIRIYDLNGRIVKAHNQSYFANGQWETEFSLGGMYIVVTEIESRVYIDKIISK